ncbi:MOSC domain-containing protein [Arthrobacter rhombi]|uniref:MOSC domain-containing protein n=1 Tax=Arthrobacter rhombi TaxID=71253 RepID=UPI003FD163BE
MQQSPKSPPGGTGASIAALYHYPVKGLSPQPLTEVGLRPGQGFPDDRIYALARAAGKYVPNTAQNLGKRNFHVLARDFALAGLRSHYDSSTRTITLARPQRDGGGVVHADLSTPAGRDRLASTVAELLGLAWDDVPVVAHEPGRRFPDLLSKGDEEAQAVSIINLASVRELSRIAGTEVNPLRFRANIYLDGLPPWAERQLPGGFLRAGGARLEVFQEIGRCPATEVDPVSSRRDLPVLQLLHDAFGHTNMGVYAQMRTAGTLTEGTAVVPE